MGNQKIKLGILCGGKSAEHEVSLQSAKNVYGALDKEKYEPIIIGIAKNGQWLLYENDDFLINPNDPKLIKLSPAGQAISLVPQDKWQIANPAKKENIILDVIFPILHGPFGEDGTVQGLFKLANIPFVGAGVLGSAVGMDKAIMKRLLRDAGLPIGKFITLAAEDALPNYAEIKNKLGDNFFIKPANMGSSVGVSKIKNEQQYLSACQEAFNYDSKIIIEEFIQGRELECSVLGNTKPVASVAGEVKPKHDFYSYEAKYIDPDGAGLIIPADLPPETLKNIQDIAVRTFKALDCAGLGRVDMFLKDDGEIMVNEINTIPGFTKISMYPKLWEESGIGYAKLIDRLIDLAMERFKEEQKLKTNYV